MSSIAGDITTATTPLSRIAAATEGLESPTAAVDLTALDANAAALRARANGVPIRIASKSVRCRAVLNRVLAAQGVSGVMAYSLREAIWLARAGVDDILMGYPTVDRTALAEVVNDRVLSGRITLMVDDVAQLDLVRDAARSDLLKPRVCIDVDASLRVGPLHIGVRRSPLRDPEQVAQFARQARSRGFRVVGLMFYEAQIAGVPDANVAVELMKSLSSREIGARRTAVVDAVTAAIGPLEIVNSGGTGSIDFSAADPAVTEVTAGSGLFAPTLFDRYRAFSAEPSLFFALPVVRKPTPRIATAFGGGYIASGPASWSRSPRPVGWSRRAAGVVTSGLKLLRNEGAGEVQTPVSGAEEVRIGDRIWFRHAKAGELCERFDTLSLVHSDGSVDAVPTYRGEGMAFG
ncbi:alanine racemase [Rhodococcus sp. 05-2256-B2]|uniref:alanine racemase n=1 Tax=unclassified Rhodococcus (in: high G+C Gram-positive bacteria) TaxID=192944 RepID=UPI00070EC592|nr:MULTISPECIES: alanine racemase [unclassified Rhodococcus (in: high G+C Gram-positive bacteria)]KQU37637.1 alanine racemase [Rhodococcus sp. Leaf233]OZD91003.1 alanine racemase [Rhodococcus sp. 05-2256-B3]OZD94388.1 alanine racemase [Rhodococcus sp. 05-2256-B4]OZE00045.1 alanine racemase [Rhodococcus sp. 05-2256-B2]OZE03966.1 alanine racemase [Rhodococcus sp. 05-2256-B1]